MCFSMVYFIFYLFYFLVVKVFKIKRNEQQQEDFTNIANQSASVDANLPNREPEGVQEVSLNRIPVRPKKSRDFIASFIMS